MWVCFHLHIIGLKFCKIVRPKRGLALFSREEGRMAERKEGKEEGMVKERRKRGREE
jgi:hypothetical protein